MMKVKKLATSLILICILKILPAQPVKPFYNEIVAFQKEDSLFPKAPGQIVFVGSSSFRKWQNLAGNFPGFNIINRGFGGSSLNHLIAYVHETVITYQPRQIIIYCGENDFASDTSLSPEAVFNRYTTLVEIIHRALPKTQIAYISMKPSVSRLHLLNKFKKANQLIQQYNHQHRYQYIDIYDIMLTPEGKPKPEIFEADNLHMNHLGYELWIPVIRPFLSIKK